MNKPPSWPALLFLGSLFFLYPSLNFAQEFSITDLGTLPGVCCSGANAINSRGQVAGVSTDAFVWSSHRGLQGLGTLSGGGYSAATAINSHGEIAGFSGTSVGTERALLWIANGGLVMQDLGVLRRKASSDAYGINDLGFVVGDSSAQTGFDHAFLWTNFTGMLDLGTLPHGNISRATAINKYDEIVGFSTIQRNRQIKTYHAFAWTLWNGIQDLGTLPGDDNSFAYAVNQGGDIAGESVLSTAGNDHAFLWTPHSGMRDLGLLPGGTMSVAHAINESDAVVGFADFSNSGGSIHAFRWTMQGGIEDLNNLISANSGWTLLEATGINGRGEIVGTGVIQGQEHAFLLTPNTGGMEKNRSTISGRTRTFTGLAFYTPNCTSNGTGVPGISVRLGCKRDER